TTTGTGAWTGRAQPIALAEEASEAFRERQISRNPIAASTNAAHWSKTVRRSVSTTVVTSGSKTLRKSGWKAAPTTALVAATAAFGTVKIQLAIDVPIGASGARTRSEPQPRS